VLGRRRRRWGGDDCGGRVYGCG